MNIKRAKEEIQNTIEAYLLKDEYGSYVIPAIRQRPVLLIGPPGVGKTQIMEQISRECGIGLVAYTITHHTRQSAIGLPFIEKQVYGGKEYSVTEYTMSEIVASIYDKIRATGLKEGILFIDEINCVSETLAPTMLQFLQGKSFGNHKIPEGWIIVSAGNPPEYNKSVREFDVVTLDRIKMIHVEPDFGVWKEYAVQESIHPAIISYLDVKPEHFCQIETTVDGKRFATPRGWEDLSRLIEVYEQLGKTVDRDVVYQYIQYPRIAKDFANYLELYHKYRQDYQVDEILAGRVREDLYRKLERAPFDERLSVVSLLLAKLTGQFREALLQEERTGFLMEQLKRYPEAEEGLSSIIQELRAEYEEKRKKELLSRLEDRLYRQVSALLEDYERIIRDEDRTDRDAVWARLKELFRAETDRYQKLADLGGQMLEYGFDFMEAAFGGSQEMVIFITELNSNRFCVAFLQEYQCDRYYEYNKSLLFEDREQELRKRAAMQLNQ